jgi:prophage regulatory protein
MRIISPAELATLKGITFSNPHRLDLEAHGKFPKRVKLGERRYGYLENELDNWLKERAALRESAAA